MHWQVPEGSGGAFLWGRGCGLGTGGHLQPGGGGRWRQKPRKAAEAVPGYGAPASETWGNKGLPSALPSPPRHLHRLQSAPAAAGAEGRSVQCRRVPGGVTVASSVPGSMAHRALLPAGTVRNCQSSRAPSCRAVTCGTHGAQAPSGFQAQGGGLCLDSAAGRCTHRAQTGNYGSPQLGCVNHGNARGPARCCQEHWGLRPRSWRLPPFPARPPPSSGPRLW